ncbi:MAG TPA: DUF3090 family protein [Actinomycetota bacterium]|nr:DUF3090 family protein [Actinomycetota bacterium]
MDLNPVVFTADYTGRPGERSFFIQARGDVTLTYSVEKQQVALLAERLREMLVMIDENDTVTSLLPQRDPAFALETPVDPQWRVGAIGIGYAEEIDNIVVSVGPVTETSEDEEVEPSEPEFDSRFFLSRDQARSFVLHALAVIAEGRPICQLCGLPMEPDGHQCPASNGHRPDPL